MHHISSINMAYALSMTQRPNGPATNQPSKFTMASPDATAEDDVSKAAGASEPQSIVNVLQAQLTQLQGVDLPQSAQIQAPVQQQAQAAAAEVTETTSPQAVRAQKSKGTVVDVMA